MDRGIGGLLLPRGSLQNGPSDLDVKGAQGLGSNCSFRAQVVEECRRFLVVRGFEDEHPVVLADRPVNSGDASAKLCRFLAELRGPGY